jgi:peptidoglycan/LPS O-acetylase OafA/YrhL
MKRIPQLDGLRAIAILAVFLHHAFKIKMLWSGVDLFFVLSGFLITGVLLDAKHHSLKGFFAHFYERRARRILAPYLIWLAVASCFLGVAWMQHWYFYILLTNFLLPLHIPHPTAFDPLWSLAVEEQFYLVWPFAVYFLAPTHLRKFCIALILLAPVLRGVFLFQDHWPIFTLTPFRMDLLAAGGLLCLLWRSHRETIERRGTLVGILCTAFGFLLLFALAHFGVTTYSNTRIGNVLIFESTLFISFGVMLYALAGRAVGWLRFAPLRYIGRISYTMYLIHYGALQLASVYLHGYWIAAVALTITVIYAAISWQLIEKPLLAQPYIKHATQ